MNPMSVSVVIPTHGRLELLAQSIESVLAQSRPPLEIVVVDDASWPPIEDGLKSIGLSSSVIRVIRVPERRGANHARNLGVRAARGSFVAFQDSDDLWLPDKLERQLRLVEGRAPHNAFVYCPVRRELEDGRVVIFPPDAPPQGDEVARQLRRGNFISTQTVLAARTLLLAQPFDESLPRLQDWEAWIRISAGADIAALPIPLAVSRETKNSISTNRDLYDEALPAVIAQHRRYFGRDKEAFAHWCRASAVATARRRRWNHSLLWFLRMIGADLQSTRSLLRGRLPRIRENGSI